eukprot:1263539-Pyramimonas_sp.AAC.1
MLTIAILTTAYGWVLRQDNFKFAPCIFAGRPREASQLTVFFLFQSGLLFGYPTHPLTVGQCRASWLPGGPQTPKDSPRRPQGAPRT